MNYLVFDEHLTPSGKTKVVIVRSAQHGFVLGRISWFGRWRQYAFFPSSDTTFSADCLQEINRMMLQLMDQRKAA